VPGLRGTSGPSPDYESAGSRGGFSLRKLSMTASSKLSAKPTAQELGWQVIASSTPYETQRFTVHEERVQLPGRSEPITYSYAERAAGVILIPVTAAGEIVLVRQYRFPVDAWCLETPAGSTSDTGDMALEDVARKELKEEIGATTERLEHVGKFYSAPAFATELCHVFVAWNVQLAKDAEPEPTEKIKIELVPAAEALARAEDGRVQNAACALALLLARRALRSAGVVLEAA
jgi:ADP-ribose pyrophosphatase